MELNGHLFKHCVMVEKRWSQISFIAEQQEDIIEWFIKNFKSKVNTNMLITLCQGWLSTVWLGRNTSSFEDSHIHGNENTHRNR